MPDHDATSSSGNWANLRAEQVLKRHLAAIEVPAVPARTMRERLRAHEEQRFVTGTIPMISSGRSGPGGPKRPPTRDWRWFVGGTGRVLISTGLLIFAFVAYQLWGTGIQYARAQDQLEQEFADQLDGFGGVSTTVSGESPPVTDAPATTAGADLITVPDAVVPPTTPVDVALGGVLGVIEIPKIEVKDFIVAGVRASDLEKGVGHYPFTPLPGQTGNVAIAGHRTTHGQPFFALDQLVAGDEIVVTTVQGQFVYSVVGTKIVDPTDVTVIFGDPARSELTLTTCHPRYSQKQRLIVTAELLPDRASYTDAQIAYDATSTPELDVSPVGTDAAVPPILVGEEAETAPPVPEGADGASLDAFSNGWFSDPDAWPQIALWGFALTGFSLLMTWFGRQTRKWLSLLVGIAPFVVLLYFWFENVNRLMPPNL